MKIIYKEGDLFESSYKILIHGCNDRGVMGSGVALIVREKYPKAYKTYFDKYKFQNDYLEGGTIIPVDCGDKIIINAITQNFYGRDGKRYAKYDWIAHCFYEINILANDIGQEFITMPLIGASLGGGDWNVISAIIQSECKDVTPVVYYLPGQKPLAAP